MNSNYYLIKGHYALTIREYLYLFSEMKKNRYIHSLFSLFGLLFVIGCAQQGAPTGGPEDEDPPVLVKATPDNYSTNFSGEKIMITFDEYLDMGNFTQELIVSPPMEEKPIVKLKNKTLIIEFEEKLKEEVTYTFNFGEGIKDLNEKNVLMNFEYVFATGELLDSLSIKGTLKNAFDLSIPETPILVMLYNDFNDSLPLQEIPYYVGRADKEGNFAVNNLRAGSYKLFVLKDGNNNFLFDLPNEQVAYLDTTLMVDGNYFREFLLTSGVYDSSDLYADTLALSLDTAGMAPDSVKMVLDSLERLKPDFNSIYVDLFLFTEDPVNQFISDYSRKQKNALNLIFSLPLTDSFYFAPVYPDFLTHEDFIPEFGLQRDSLILWLADTVVASNDTIRLELLYTALDSLENAVWIVDTLQFAYRPPMDSKKSAKEKEKKESGLKVSTIRSKGKHHILKDLSFTIDTPLDSIDASLFELFSFQDTVEIPETVFPFYDTTHLRRLKIRKEWKEEGSYRIVLYPGAIKDIYGMTNDTIDLRFSIRPLAEYGRINLAIENVEEYILVQIMNKDKVVRMLEVSSPGTYTFEFLDPEVYTIKFVYDRNRNGKWDTGKYVKGVQPERVEFLPKELKVRANWDHDIEYIMGSNSSAPAKGGEEEKENPPIFQ